MESYEKTSDSISGQTQQQQPGKEHELNPQPVYIRGNYKGSEKLFDKVALITGGDSGIGRAIAVHYAREGADVAIIYLNEDKDAEETKSLVEKEGGKCLLIRGDLKDRAFCKLAIEKTLHHYGRINILINHAGEQHPSKGFEELNLDLMEQTFKTNIFAMYYLTKSCLKHMEEGDSIIMTSSVTAYEGSPRFLDYAATNGAIVSFTRSLAQNLAKKKIRVNAVAPGPIWTPLIPATFEKEEVENFGKNVPLERPGQPCEVAPCYVFLASEDASYFTGQVLHPNGGKSMQS